jgi:hypothetical protein
MAGIVPPDPMGGREGKGEGEVIFTEKEYLSLFKNY